jgi:hypothetical protein
LADELRVRAASVDITPPVGTPMARYYAERFSKGVHDATDPARVVEALR